MSHNEKKCLKQAFLCVFSGVLVLSGLFFVSNVYASVGLPTDNFDTYTIGEINGQGGWWGTSNAVVENTTFFSSPNALGITTSSANAYKVADEAVLSGIVTFEGYLKSSGDSDITLSFCNFPTYDCDFFIRAKKSGGVGVLQHRPVADWISVGDSFTLDAWHKFYISFDGTAKKFKMKVDDTDWSSLINYADDHGTIINTYIAFTNSYIDDLGYNELGCEVGQCSLCEVWTSCQSAGCNWSCAEAWSGLGCWCSEPVSSPEACGGFFHCQYCDNQTDCESADPTCEWATRGEITRCFTKLPVIPEAQTEWQTCELEDCDLVEGVEHWICLLKNTLAGIYCPEQETLTDLQDTINSFHTKFPFNYIEAIKQFFTDIKTSLATPKGITIGMFGASGSINFDFTEIPVTIGGQAETIGDIFIFATSALIYIALFFWLLAFIRRFF